MFRGVRAGPLHFLLVVTDPTGDSARATFATAYIHINTSTVHIHAIVFQATVILHYILHFRVYLRHDGWLVMCSCEKTLYFSKLPKKKNNARAHTHVCFCCYFCSFPLSLSCFWWFYLSLLFLFCFIAVYSVCMHEHVCTKDHQVLTALHSGTKYAPNKCNYDMKITTLLSGTIFPVSVGSHMLTKKGRVNFLTSNSINLYLLRLYNLISHNRCGRQDCRGY